MIESLLDTDILSSIMRSHELALKRAAVYAATHSRFSFSIITRYELLRGLHAKEARTQIGAFNRFCAANRVLPITDEIIEKAAETYGSLHREGNLIGDADILIASTALVYKLKLITNNERHFRRFPGLEIENWLAP